MALSLGLMTIILIQIIIFLSMLAVAGIIMVVAGMKKDKNSLLVVGSILIGLSLIPLVFVICILFFW